MRFYDPKLISKTIANGHGAYHFTSERLVNGHPEKEAWKALGVTNKAEFEKKIYHSIMDKNTKVYQGIDKRDFYYNKKNNIIVIIQHGNKDFGTAFIADGKKEKFKYFYNNDLKERKKANIGKSYIFKGGYNKLYNNKKLVKKRQEFKTNFTPSKPNPRGFKAYVEKEKALKLKLEKKKVIQKELTKNEKLIQRKTELELIRQRKKESLEKGKIFDKKQKLEKTAQIQKLKEKVKTSEAVKKDKTEVEKKRTEEEKRKKLEEIRKRQEEIRRRKEAERKEKEKQKEMQYYKKF